MKKTNQLALLASTLSVVLLCGCATSSRQQAQLNDSDKAGLTHHQGVQGMVKDRSTWVDPIYPAALF